MTCRACERTSVTFTIRANYDVVKAARLATINEKKTHNSYLLNPF